NKWVTTIKTGFERLSLAGLGALFKQNPWAAQRLSGFAGKTFCFRLLHAPAGLPEQWSMRIARDGFFEPWSADRYDLTLSLAFEARLLAQLAQQGPQALLPMLNVEGDVMLAAAIGEVFRDLQWDWVAPLETITGPLIAHRLDLHLQRCVSGLQHWFAASAWARPGPSTASRETRPRPSM
ncbi:MAG: hypothetical protein RL539_523, partial [Pseudomonadota bacterium]